MMPEGAGKIVSEWDLLIEYINRTLKESRMMLERHQRLAKEHQDQIDFLQKALVGIDKIKTLEEQIRDRDQIIKELKEDLGDD